MVKQAIDTKTGEILESPYKARGRVQLTDFEPSLTKEAFKDECDFNAIMKRYEVSGQLPINQRIPQFGDFTDVSDYHTAMNKVVEVHDFFDSLDARIRAKFENDPGQFVDYISDPANVEEVNKLGLDVVEVPKKEAPLEVSDSGQESVSTGST